MNESCGANGCGVNYEGQSAYDVADMLKQYFRDLPEPLLTSKLSDTFLQIYQCKIMHTFNVFKHNEDQKTTHSFVNVHKNILCLAFISLYVKNKAFPEGRHK